jgi:RimJ/RimL family protein N-acetyltransferase
MKKLKSEQISEVNCELSKQIKKGSIEQLDRICMKLKSPPWEFRCHDYDGVKDFFMFIDEEGRIGHITWIYYAGDPNKDIKLRRNEAELKYGLTDKKHRGKHLLPATLVKIQKYLKKNGIERVFATITESNYASLKATERAGFRRIKMKRSIRIFGMLITPRFIYQKKN